MQYELSWVLTCFAWFSGVCRVMLRDDACQQSTGTVRDCESCEGMAYTTSQGASCAVTSASMTPSEVMVLGAHAVVTRVLEAHVLQI
jgi:hypothetical protein